MLRPSRSQHSCHSQTAGIESRLLLQRRCRANTWLGSCAILTPIQRKSGEIKKSATEAPSHVQVFANTGRVWDSLLGISALRRPVARPCLPATAAGPQRRPSRRSPLPASPGRRTPRRWRGRRWGRRPAGRGSAPGSPAAAPPRGPRPPASRPRRWGPGPARPDPPWRGGAAGAARAAAAGTARGPRCYATGRCVGRAARRSGGGGEAGRVISLASSLKAASRRRLLSPLVKERFGRGGRPLSLFWARRRLRQLLGLTRNPPPVRWSRPAAPKCRRRGRGGAHAATAGPLAGRGQRRCLRVTVSPCRRATPPPGRFASLPPVPLPPPNAPGVGRRRGGPIAAAVVERWRGWHWGRRRRCHHAGVAGAVGGAAAAGRERRDRAAAVSGAGEGSEAGRAGCRRGREWGGGGAFVAARAARCTSVRGTGSSRSWRGRRWSGASSSAASCGSGSSGTSGTARTRCWWGRRGSGRGGAGAGALSGLWPCLSPRATSPTPTLRPGRTRSWGSLRTTRNRRRRPRYTGTPAAAPPRTDPAAPGGCSRAGLCFKGQ